MKKAIAFLLCLVLLCSLLSACASKEETATPEAAEQPAENTEPETKETDEPEAEGEEAEAPAETEDFSETGMLNLSWPSDNGTDLLPFPWSNRNYAVAMLFDSLVVMSPDGETMIPKIAKDWTISEDGLTYTFTIRDDVTWHDGTPLTPEDVVFSINGYLKNPTSEYPSQFALIEGGEAVAAGEADELTGIEVDGNVVTIHLTSPRNDFLTYCAIVSILPKHILGDKDPTLISQDEEFLLNPVGCGPYKVETVNAPNYFTLVRNDDYYGEPAGIRHVTYTSYANGGADASSAAMIAGNLDFIYNVSDISRAENLLANNPNLSMNVIPANYARYFVFNTAGATDGKYNDDMLKTEVRQAINLLLDKTAIANFYVGQAAPLTTFVNPESASYNSDIPLFERDVDTAVQMLKDADFDFNRPVRIAYWYTDQTTADIMALVVQCFADAGIEAETTMVSGSIVEVVYNQHNWDLAYFGNYGLDPVDAFYYNLRTPTGLFVNIQGDYELDTKAEFSALYDEYFSVETEDEKQAILNELQVKHLESMYTIPLYALNKVTVANTGKFSYPSDLFNMDILDWQDYRFETWALLSE